MAYHRVLYVLLLALLHQQTMATRQVLNAGEEFRLTCALNDQRDGYTIQFFIERIEVKMFNTKTYIDDLKVISDGTTLKPTIANYTDRYAVEKPNNLHILIIKNVTDSDSAWYGCRSFNEALNTTGSTVLDYTELLVPGPFDGLFWTADFGGLDLDIARQNEIPDGGITVTDGRFGSPEIACAVLVSNLEPTVNITIGRFGEPGSEEITDRFETRSSSVTTAFDAGTRFRSTVFFVRKFSFSKSVRDVFCRASLLGKTYEASVNIQVTSKPKNTACDPAYFGALIGNKNVNLTCLIETHPEPYVEWVLPGGTKISTLSNDPNYKVTNVAIFEGLLTTLTISEVGQTDGISDFGRFAINANNTEGSGEYHLYFEEGYIAAAGIAQSSTTLSALVVGLLIWMLK